LVKPGRGACRYHSMNSSSAILYTRRVIGEETLSRTSALTFDLGSHHTLLHCCCAWPYKRVT
jgi:hypothetical protein